MKRISIRQIFAMTLLALVASPLSAQFQQLYHYGSLASQSGGIFKDVQCLDNVGPNNENIVTVGSDSQAPANGILAYHTIAGTPVTYLRLNNTLGHLCDAAALCNTPSNKLVACYFDPADRASDIVFANNDGTVNWTSRIPNFRVRDVVATSGGPGNPENFYFTGNIPGPVPTIAVARMTATGALTYFKVYQLAAPYSNNFGFEIDYSPTTQRLTVVGRTSIAGCPDGILVLRLMPATGNLIWANVYSSPGCNFELSGKALVRTPGAFNRYTIAFEHKDPANPVFTFPGLLEINGSGAVTGCYYTTGFTFFDGREYVVEGIDTDGTGVMVSGSFRNLGGNISGYSLAVSPTAGSINFTEYESTGAYAPNETKLVDLDYSALRGGYVMGGHFRSTAKNWPLMIDVAFWLVDANTDGSSTCSVMGNTTDHTFAPNVNAPQIVEETKDDITQSPLSVNEVDPEYFNQCTAKRGSSLHESLETELLSEESATFAYLQGKGQILATIPADVKSDVNVKLLDMNGRVLSSYNLAAGEHHLNVNNIAAGVYFLQFQGKDITAGVQKIAIR